MIKENMIIALTAYDWDFTEHYLYNAEEMPDKEVLDFIQEMAYKEAKSKIRSGIRIKPSSHEILREMVKLLHNDEIFPIKVLSYDVEEKEFEEIENSL